LSEPGWPGLKDEPGFLNANTVQSQKSFNPGHPGSDKKQKKPKIKKMCAASSGLREKE